MEREGEREGRGRGGEGCEVVAEVTFVGGWVILVEVVSWGLVSGCGVGRGFWEGVFVCWI